MKGYSPRERLGLIMLGLVVASLFLLERIVDSAGCERTGKRDAEISVSNDCHLQSASGEDIQTVTKPVSDNSDWVSRTERSETHRQSDSIRDARKKYRKDSLRSNTSANKGKKKSSKAQKKSQQATPPTQRSLRDERLNSCPDK